MTEQDVMIIFDTKGDYYNRFAKPGDVVLVTRRSIIKTLLDGMFSRKF